MKKRNAVIAAVLTGAIGWSTARCTYKPDDSVGKLRYEYNAEYNMEMLVGQTKSIKDLYIMKLVNEINNNTLYVLAEKIVDDKYLLVGTTTMYTVDYDSEEYSLISVKSEYIIPLIDIANYFDNTVITGRIYTADEINYLIEQLKNNEEQILENEKIRKRTK